MLVFVRMLSGRSMTLDVEPTGTIRTLCEMVEEREGIPVDSQRIVYEGRLVELDRTFQDYNVQAEATLFMVLRLRRMIEEPAPAPEPVKHVEIRFTMPDGSQAQIEIPENSTVSDLREGIAAEIHKPEDTTTTTPAPLPAIRLFRNHKLLDRRDVMDSQPLGEDKWSESESDIVPVTLKDLF